MKSFRFVLLWIISVQFTCINTSCIFKTNEDNKHIITKNYKTFPVSYFRPTWIEIELDSVRSNVRQLKQLIGDKVHLMAVVKTNAYGYGTLEIAETAISAGATWLGVATLDEAIVLRSKLSNVPILVLGYVSPVHLVFASRYHITVTAVSLQWIQEAEKVTRHSFDFHLKLDTGLNRLGCKTLEEVHKVARIVSNNPNMNWKGAFTHFSNSSDVVNRNYYYRQLALFHKFLTIIPDLKNKIIHCANSGATLYQVGKPFFNMVRIGEALFGPPIDNLKYLQSVPLKTVAFSLHSTLILVKQLNAGEKVSYGGKYTAKRKQWIGTIPIGYGDGWHQKLGVNTVLIGGKRVPIVGLITMDQLMVALPRRYSVGTQVTLIGQQGNQTIEIEELKKSLDRIKSEILCSFSIRIPRLYIEDGLVLSIRNSLLDQVTLA